MQAAQKKKAAAKRAADEVARKATGGRPPEFAGMMGDTGPAIGELQALSIMLGPACQLS